MGLYFAGPLFGSKSPVQHPVIDGLAESQVNAGDLLFKHLVGQVKHFNVGFNTQKSPDAGQVVKEIGIPATDVNRYDVALVLFGLVDKAFVPLQVNDFAFDLAGAQAGRKIQDLGIRLVGLFNLPDIFTALFAMFVNWHKYGLQVFDVQQNVVYNELNVGEDLPHFFAKSQSVESSQGVVCHKDEPAFTGYMLFPE
jgi:hypothetical protein